MAQGHGVRLEPLKSLSSGESRPLVSGGVIARNTLLNLVGQAVPLLVGLVAMPLVTAGLGPDRFGLLTLAWVIAGYLTLFDLGLGRATTRYVAEMVALGRSERVPDVIWTSVLTQLGFGSLGTVALVAATPVLVGNVLKLSADLQAEAKLTFYLLAVGIPVSLVSTSLSGALEARQRFDLTNAVRVPSATLLYVAPVAGVLLGLSLPFIVGLIVGGRAIAVAALLILNAWVEAGFRGPRVSVDLLPALLGFGGWVTVSAVIGPVLVYAERLLLGALVSVAAVGYYSAAADAVTRLLIIAGSFSGTLFPVFSQLGAVGDRQKLVQLLDHTTRYLAAALLPVILTLIIFADDLLRLWLGPKFAEHSTGALRLLALGVLANSLGYVAFALLQAIGKADLTAKLHGIEVVGYVPLAVGLIHSLGVTGAALAWAIRVVFDALALFTIALLLLDGDWPVRITLGAVRTVAAFGLASAAIWLGKAGLPDAALGARSLVGGLGVAVFCALSWRYVLDSAQRNMLALRLGLR